MNPLIPLLEGTDQLILILVSVRTVMDTPCGQVEGAIMNIVQQSMFDILTITVSLTFQY